MSARRIAVIGFGVTGRAVAAYAAGRNYDVVVLEDRAGEDLVADGRDMGIVVEPTPPIAAALAERLGACDFVVPSPGVPVDHPVYAVAASLGLPVVSEIELAAEALDPSRTRLVAITGTNGKTTVTTLVQAALAAAGMDAVAAGNIGLPLIDAVQSGHDAVVAEVSSFQLQYTRYFRPSVSCWLNLAPDHLDWHPSMEHYAAAKARIWANQAGGDTAVYNADDRAVAVAARAVPDGVARLSYSVTGPADVTVTGGSIVGPQGRLVMAVDELPRTLPHDVSNALAAVAVSMSAGAPAEACREALVRTGPLPHRVSLVGAADGVSWYDDSKATTPASVLAAVAGFESVVLIAGGRNKGLDLAVLAAAVPPVRAAVGIGEAAGEVVAALGRLVPVSVAETMEAAVAHAAAVARRGDAVLLSPGCASFDWYSSYAARGDDFARLVRTHLLEGGASC